MKIKVKKLMQQAFFFDEISLKVVSVAPTCLYAYLTSLRYAVNNMTDGIPEDLHPHLGQSITELLDREDFFCLPLGNIPLLLTHDTYSWCTTGVFFGSHFVVIINAAFGINFQELKNSLSLLC